MDIATLWLNWPSSSLDDYDDDDDKSDDIIPSTGLASRQGPSSQWKKSSPAQLSKVWDEDDDDNESDDIIPFAGFICFLTFSLQP